MNGHVVVPAIVEPQTPDVADEGALDDPIVYGKSGLSSSYAVTWPYILPTVNGVPKAFSDVTEDDHGLMTPEEYTAYFEVFETRASF